MEYVRHTIPHELILRAVEGDSRAVQEIVDRFEPLIRKKSRLSGYRLIIDFAQECRCKICELIKKFNCKDLDLFPGYIDTMLTYHLNNKAEKYYYINKCEDLGDGSKELPDKGKIDVKIRAEYLDIVSVQANFSPKEQKIFTAYFENGISTYEIADGLGCSRQYVCRMLEHMRSKLVR